MTFIVLILKKSHVYGMGFVLLEHKSLLQKTSSRCLKLYWVGFIFLYGKEFQVIARNSKQIELSMYFQGVRLRSYTLLYFLFNKPPLASSCLKWELLYVRFLTPIRIPWGHIKQNYRSEYIIFFFFIAKFAEHRTLEIFQSEVKIWSA